LGNLLAGTLFLAFTLMFLSASLWDYELLARNNFIRTLCLIAWITIGLGATLCLAGAMHCVIDILHSPTLRLPWRLILRLSKRALLLLQLATTALAVAAAGIWIFHTPVPGADNSILFPGWSPPEEPAPAGASTPQSRLNNIIRPASPSDLP
jgi:hypothetical protein